MQNSSKLKNQNVTNYKILVHVFKYIDMPQRTNKQTNKT